MGLTLARTIYTHSDVAIRPISNNPTGCLSSFTGFLGGNIGTLVSTVQNATFTLNIPRADVNVFGLQGVLDRPQLEAESATLEFGFIPEICGSPGVEAGQPAGLNHAACQMLICDAIANSPDYVTARSANVGAITQGLMNSFSGEGSVGALPTFTMSFTGANNDAANPHNPEDAQYPDLDIGGANIAPVIASTLTAKAKVVTPKDINLRHSCVTDASGSDPRLLDEIVTYAGVGGSPAGTTDEGGSPATPDAVIDSCAQSVSFAWDVPVETILCLGGDPTKDGIALGNPPGTASFTVEALSSQLATNTAAQNYKLLFGHYLFTLANGNIDSRTHSLAVGDLYGSYNYVIGGTGDGFTVEQCCTAE